MNEDAFWARPASPAHRRRALLAIALPNLLRAGLLGFVPLPGPVLFALAGISTAYVAAAEALERRLYGRAA